tara:strand:- start:173 stop:505 length:333 start_codon:yes stop_codon:yes gene_type:complete
MQTGNAREQLAQSADINTLIRAIRMSKMPFEDQEKIWAVRFKLDIDGILKNIRGIADDADLRKRHQLADDTPYMHGENFKTFEQAQAYAFMCVLHGNDAEIINLTTGERI